MRYQLFIKHFLKKASTTEKEKLDNWRSLKPENDDVFKKLESHWSEGKFLENYYLYNKIALSNVSGIKKEN